MQRAVSRHALPCALALAALAANSHALARDLDTYAGWDGVGYISSWGVIDTATYGQTITVTGTQRTMTGFTVYLDPQTSASNPLYQAFVYQWDAAANHVVGQALYSSAVATAPSATGFSPVTFDTGTLALTPGQQYVVILTTSTVPAASQPGVSSYSWGAAADNAAYAGGQFYFLNNGADASLLGQNSWSGLAQDLAFKATFLPPVAVSVSNTGATAASEAAVVLDSLIATGATGDMGTVLDAFDTLATDRQFADAAKQTLPLLSANMPHATLDALHGVNRVLQARSEGANKADIVGKQTVWVSPYGSWAEQRNHGGISGYSVDTYGVVLGLERYLARDRFGAALAYSDLDIDSKDTAAKNTADVDAYQLIVYGTHILDESTDVTWQLDYGRGETAGRRLITFGGLDRVAESDYRSEVLHAGVGIGRVLSLGERTTLTPSLKADYSRIHTPGYTESGADALNLAVASNNTAEFVFAFDGKLVHAFSERFLLTANLGFGFDAIDKQTSILAAYQGGGAAFATTGIDRSPWLFDGGLGLVFKVSDRFEISGRYEGEFRSTSCNQTGSLRLALLF